MTDPIDPHAGVLEAPELVCPTCEDTGPFWACIKPTCPVVECSECGQRFRCDTGDTIDTGCQVDKSATPQ